MSGIAPLGYNKLWFPLDRPNIEEYLKHPEHPDPEEKGSPDQKHRRQPNA
jgi:hypothetical protein